LHQYGAIWWFQLTEWHAAGIQYSPFLPAGRRP
jgi:hypothetical protein